MLAALDIVTDHSKIVKMNNKDLDQQLEIHHWIRNNKDVLIKAHIKQKAKKLKALLAAIAWHEKCVHLLFYNVTANEL